MKVQFNLTDSTWDLERFQTRGELLELLQGFDGLELMHLEKVMDQRGLLTKDLVVGYHASIPQYWLDFWNGDRSRLEQEFGTLEKAFAYYKGTKPGVLRWQLKGELEYAMQMEAEYLVLHVSDAAAFEELTGHYHYSDIEVIDALCGWVNEVFPETAEENMPWLLLENLWQPGLTMTDPDMTERLMEGILYPKKGIMLDTGHLMHTNTQLRTQKEALQYIHHCLDAHGSLCEWIKGVHLHQSLTGAVMRRYQKHPPRPAETYEERQGQLFEYVFQVDQHKPFIINGIQELIARIHPDYLTYEFISRDLKEHRKMLNRQWKALHR